MLLIRADQLGSLAEGRFQQRLIQLLLESVPNSRGAIDTPASHQILREQCAKARGYGMRAELDVARYVITAWLLGVDFDVRFPAMTEILASPSLTVSQKADAISQGSSAVLIKLEEGHR